MKCSTTDDPILTFRNLISAENEKLADHFRQFFFKLLTKKLCLLFVKERRSSRESILIFLMDFFCQSSLFSGSSEESVSDFQISEKYMRRNLLLNLERDS